MRRSAVSTFALLLGSVATASAHLNLLRPRLLDIVEKSDIIIIAVIDASRGSQDPTSARVVKVLAGPSLAKTVRFRSRAHMRAGGRFVLFGRGAEPFELVTTAGEVFEADPSDDALLARLVTALRVAAKSAGDNRTRLRRQALIPALAARGETVRYQAALELGRLATVAPLTAAERELLRKAAAADPVIEPILSTILRAEAAPGAHK